MTVELMQQLKTTSLADTQASTSDANSRAVLQVQTSAVFLGANLKSSVAQ